MTNEKALRSYKNEYIKFDISKLVKSVAEATDMGDLNVFPNATAEKKDIHKKTTNAESKNQAWLVEHNRKLRESAVWRTFKKLKDEEKVNDYCGLLKRRCMDSKRSFFYNNEDFYGDGSGN